jgi:hypothetical protein
MSDRVGQQRGLHRGRALIPLQHRRHHQTHVVGQHGHDAVDVGRLPRGRIPLGLGARRVQTEPDVRVRLQPLGLLRRHRTGDSPVGSSRRRRISIRVKHLFVAILYNHGRTFLRASSGPSTTPLGRPGCGTKIGVWQPEASHGSCSQPSGSSPLTIRCTWQSIRPGRMVRPSAAACRSGWCCRDRDTPRLSHASGR